MINENQEKMDTYEKKRIERVYAVFVDFYHRLQEANDWLKFGEMADIAFKLTQIYFDNCVDVFLDDMEVNENE